MAGTTNLGRELRRGPTARRCRRRKQRGSRRLPRAVGAVRRRQRGTTSLRQSGVTRRQRGSLRLPQVVGAVRRRQRGAGGSSSRRRGGDAVVRESDALSSSAHGRRRRPFARSAGPEIPLTHERREAPFERPRNRMPALSAPRAAPSREDITGRTATEKRGSSDASFVGAGDRECFACSQNAPRSADSTGRRPASGQNPRDSGDTTRKRRSLERQRVPGSETTASPRAVRVSGEAVNPLRTERRNRPAVREQ